ncbi:unnamed protein product [Mucor hiemalis]
MTLPIDITSSRNPSMHNTTPRVDKGDPLNYDNYSNLPPPPYTKSSSASSSSSSTVNNSAQAAANNINGEEFVEESLHGITSEPLAALQHIKDYFTRLKDQSFIGPTTHENSSDNTDNDPNDSRSMITINNIIMPSLRSPPHEPSGTDILINEGLERIGHSLQQLIHEAQASLTKKPSQRQQKRPQTQPLVTDAKASEPSHSQHYILKRYSQSQEKISVAMEQLEQSIQSMSLSDIVSDEVSVNSTITTVEHHHKRSPDNSSTASCSKRPPSNDDESKLMRFIKSRLWRLFIANIKKEDDDSYR